MRIFILLYKELTLALGLNSMYTKKALQGRNIRVLRHPDRIGNEDFQFKEFLWVSLKRTLFIIGTAVCIDVTMIVYYFDNQLYQVLNKC